MKLQDLLEMPKFIPRELPVIKTVDGAFCSEDTIKSDYEFVAKINDLSGEDLWILLSKDKRKALIGLPGIRSDKKPGLRVFATADIKAAANFSYLKELNIPDHVLQIDGVEAHNKRFGYGYFLYFGLIKAGYVVVSDNVQYLGGKALWKKIVKRSKLDDFRVYIVKDADVLVKKDGNPIVYDGINLDDDQIWSLDNKELFTVLVAKKNT